MTITDVRRAGHCATGIRDWCEAIGIDFRDFMKNGIAESDLLALNDGIANAVVKKVRERRDD